MNGSILCLALAGILAPFQAAERTIGIDAHSVWETLSVDDPALLGGFPTVRLRIHPKSDGKVTVYASSYHFDVTLRIESEAGDIMAEDDDGGVETNARLVVSLKAKRDCWMLVASKSGRGGKFWVDCRSGEQPAPPPDAELDTAVLFYANSAAEAQRQNELSAAAELLEKEGSFLRRLSKLEKAEEVWTNARDLWAQVGEKRREAGATLELGRLAAARKNTSAAEERFAAALAAYRAIPDPAGVARALLAIGDARAAAGDLAAGAARYEEAAAAAEACGDFECAALALTGLADTRRASGDRRGEREALARLGVLWRDQREFGKARESHQKAVDIARETKDEPAEGRAWAELGLDWLQAREWTHARECFEKALQIARETGGKVAQAEALGGLGRLSSVLKDLPAALAYYQQQLEAAGEDPVQSCEATVRIGICLHALRDDARARTTLESAVEKARTAGQRLSEADALDHLSLIELKAGSLDKASAHRERAKQLRSGSNEKLLTGMLNAEHLFLSGEIKSAQAAFGSCLELERSNRDPWARMGILLRLSECLERAGRYAEAIRCSSEMLELTRTLGDRLDEIEALERLGVQYRGVGALDAALEHLEEALSIARDFDDSIQVLDCLNDLANVRLDLGEYDEALEKYAEAGELAHKLQLPVQEMVAVNNVGVTYGDSGRWEESRAPLEQAVQKISELRSPNYLAEFRGNLARTLRKLGERVRAEELATQSVETMEALGVADSDEPRKLLTPLEVLVGLALDAGDIEKAKGFLDRANDVLEQVRLQAQASPEDVGVNPWLLCLPFDRFGQDLARLLDLEGGREPAERARLLAGGFLLADRARARELACGIIEHRRGTRSKEAMAARAEWKGALASVQEVEQELSAAIRGGRSSEETDRLQKEVLDRRKKAGHLEAALSDSSPRDAALDLPKGVGPDAIRKAAIAPGSALVEYAEGETDLYAYVLTPTSLSLVDLGRRAAIDDGVQGYLGELTGAKTPSGPVEIGRDGHALFQSLLAAPLAAAGEGVQRLLIVPTPSLSVLPFDALVASAPSDARGFGDLEFVIDRCEVDYSPSASILVELANGGPRQSVGKMLVMADPVYPSEVHGTAPSSVPKPGDSPSLLMGGHRGPDGQEFRRLPRTREEAFEIADKLVDPSETEALAQLASLRSARDGSLHARKFDLCLGADATAARLKGNLRPYGILHLAAHGWIDGQFPRKTGIALSSSGSGPYQGFLTIADVSGLDLDANLVVLSACDTARGKVLAGEGVESMARAFLLAGSRRVVASLWQVADQVAAETMKSFYAGIFDRDAPKPCSEALREAKLSIRRGSSPRGLAGNSATGGTEGHPSTWAPFIYIGPPQ